MTLNTGRYADHHDLEIEIANKVATVALHRPELRNAINQRLIRELRDIWEDIGDAPGVNVMLLTGTGDRFSVGGDVKAMSDRPGGDVLRKGEVHDPMISRRLVTRQLDLDKPIVCAINGDCVGLGNALDQAVDQPDPEGPREPHARSQHGARTGDVSARRSPGGDEGVQGEEEGEVRVRSDGRHRPSGRTRKAASRPPDFVIRFAGTRVATAIRLACEPQVDIAMEAHPCAMPLCHAGRYMSP